MTTDEQAIRDLQRRWIDATAAGDLAAVLALMTDDVVFLAPGRPPFGRDEFAAAFEAGRRAVTLSGTARFEEVVVAGDVAYARGRLDLAATPTAGGPPRRLSGDTLSVFRRRDDGSWALARDANLVGPVEPSA